MTGLRLNALVGALAGASLFVSSTGAVAATSVAPAYQVNPWAALAVMSGTAPATVLCGSAAVAAAGATPGGCVLPAVDQAAPVAQAGPPEPIPVPPVEAAGGGLGIDPLLLALGAIVAGVGLYFLIHHHHNSPNSPA